MRSTVVPLNAMVFDASENSPMLVLAWTVKLLVVGIVARPVVWTPIRAIWMPPWRRRNSAEEESDALMLLMRVMALMKTPVEGRGEVGVAVEGGQARSASLLCNRYARARA